MLLPQTHIPEVDYSLFIMETMEMSMEKKETSPAGLRRSFPPPHPRGMLLPAASPGPRASLLRPISPEGLGREKCRACGRVIRPLAGPKQVRAGTVAEWTGLVPAQAGAQAGHQPEPTGLRPIRPVPGRVHGGGDTAVTAGGSAAGRGERGAEDERNPRV